MIKALEQRDITYVGIQRHPLALRSLIRNQIASSGLTFHEVGYEDSVEVIDNAFRSSRAVLFAPGRFLPDEIFANNSHLELLQVWSSGFDKFNVNGAKKYGHRIANNGGANSIAVAEHTIMLMLAVYKRLPEMHQRVVNGDWAGNSHGMNMFLLHKKTLGLIGLGAIGAKVAKLARAFEMRVVYHDVTQKRDLESQLELEFVELDDLLRMSDIVSLHLHLSPDTHHLVSKSRISILKPGAVVINVSRGKLIDNSALLEALKSGSVGGAGFDVYDEEPTVPGNELTNHPNVVCTPHSANTLDTHKMALTASISNIRRVLAGSTPLWLIG